MPSPTHAVPGAPLITSYASPASDDAVGFLGHGVGKFGAAVRRATLVPLAARGRYPRGSLCRSMHRFLHLAGETQEMNLPIAVLISLVLACFHPYSMQELNAKLLALPLRARDLIARLAVGSSRSPCRRSWEQQGTGTDAVANETRAEGIVVPDVATRRNRVLSAARGHPRGACSSREDSFDTRAMRFDVSNSGIVGIGVLSAIVIVVFVAAQVDIGAGDTGRH